LYRRASSSIISDGDGHLRLRGLPGDVRTTGGSGLRGARRGCDGHAVEGTFDVPLSADELERTVLRLAQHGTTRRATPGVGASRDVGATAERPLVDAERLGASLAAALLAADVGAAYRRAVERAEHHGHGTRLTLSMADAPALLSVPWEFLYERPRFLASQRRTPIVRLLDTGSMARPPVIEGAARILGIIASPRDLAPLDVDAERLRITKALTPVVDAGQVRLDWLEPASPKSLRIALRDGNYHVIHYVGHSDFTAEGSGVIYLVDPTPARPWRSTRRSSPTSCRTSVRCGSWSSTPARAPAPR
jgi:hypothetical protein